MYTVIKYIIYSCGFSISKGWSGWFFVLHFPVSVVTFKCVNFSLFESARVIKIKKLVFDTFGQSPMELAIHGDIIPSCEGCMFCGFNHELIDVGVFLHFQRLKVCSEACKSGSPNSWSSLVMNYSKLMALEKPSSWAATGEVQCWRGKRPHMKHICGHSWTWMVCCQTPLCTIRWTTKVYRVFTSELVGFGGIWMSLALSRGWGCMLYNIISVRDSPWVSLVPISGPWRPWGA